LKDELASLHSLESMQVKLKPFSYGLLKTLKIVKVEKAFKAEFESSSAMPEGILDDEID